MAEFYTIEQEKLEAVVRRFNDEVDPKATEELVRTELLADWNEGEEHQDWLDNADVAEIVDWLASFYN